MELFQLRAETRRGRKLYKGDIASYDGREVQVTV